MNRKIVVQMLGKLLLLEAVLMLLPMLIALGRHEACASAFAITIGLAAICSLPMLLQRPKSKAMYAREGFLIVSFSWILFSVFGALPFYLSGQIPSFIDSFFETVSGFTTTGASILNNVEALENGLLFWRSFTHWIGGMGILVLALALFSGANDRAMHVMRAEVPGPAVSKLVPKTKTTALYLYLIYFFLTVVEIILLSAEMPFFDSVVTAFGTAGTGGFGIKNTSIGFYNSAYIDVVVTVFMFLFGINFNLYFLLLSKNIRQVVKNEEFHWYLGITVASILIITFNILPMVPSFGTALQQASFQVSSIITTTGFSTTDFNLWPQLSKTILFLLMFLGACGGSTGGGLKVSRFVIMCKSLVNEVRRIIHPHAIRPIRLDGKVVDQETTHRVLVYFVGFMLITCAAVLLVSIDGFDTETTVTSVVACMGNIGPGLGVVGPAGNFSAFSDLSKIVLSMAMLFGRLEIFPLLLMFVPSFYKGRKHTARV